MFLSRPRMRTRPIGSGLGRRNCRQYADPIRSLISARFVLDYGPLADSSRTNAIAVWLVAPQCRTTKHSCTSLGLSQIGRLFRGVVETLVQIPPARSSIQGSTRAKKSGVSSGETATSPTKPLPLRDAKSTGWARRDGLLAGLVNGYQHRAPRLSNSAPLNISGRAVTCVRPPARPLPQSPTVAVRPGRTPTRRSAFRGRAHSGPGQRGSARS